MNPYLTVKEIASVLKLNPLTIYLYIHKGKLTAFRLGRNYRVEKKDFERFIREQKVRKSL